MDKRTIFLPDRGYIYRAIDTGSGVVLSYLGTVPGVVDGVRPMVGEESKRPEMVTASSLGTLGLISHT